MPVFQYKATTRDGEVLQGEMEGADRAAVVARIQEAGHIPIRIEQAKAGPLAGLLQRRSLGGRRIRQRDVATFTEELASLLHAGLPLDRAFQITLDVSDDEAVKRLVGKLQEAVRAGASLSAALEAQGRVFSPFYVNMVRAAEVSGTLDQGLARLAAYLESAKALRDKVLSALIYPAILVAVAAVSLVIILTYVVPKVTQLFSDVGQALPVSTRVVIGAADLLQNYWWALLLLVLGLVAYFRHALTQPRSRYRWDQRALRAPLLGELVRTLETARLCRSLGTLLANGVPLLSALGIAKDTLSNRVMAEALAETAETLKAGRGLAEPLLAQGLFPRLALQMVKVGEETGHLDEMLLRVAEIYDRQTATSIQRLLALMEPVLIVGLGLVIGGIIMSMLVAIVSVNELPV